jgi:hypothetical protein
MKTTLAKNDMWAVATGTNHRTVILAIAPVEVAVHGNADIRITPNDPDALGEYRFSPDNFPGNRVIHNGTASTSTLSRCLQFGHRIRPGDPTAADLLRQMEAHLDYLQTQVGVSFTASSYRMYLADLKPLLDALKPKRPRVVIRTLEGDA